MDGFRGTLALGFGILIIGCSAAPEVPFPNWVAGDKETRSESYSDAFKQLAHAATDAERIASDDLNRVSFTPGKKTSLLQELTGPMARVAQASRANVDMPERAAEPFQTLPYQRGWRLIGRAMGWKIERAVAAEELNKAVDWTVAATRFGLALTAGSSTDAALGFVTMNEARAALGPAIGKLDASALRRLGTGIEAALASKPATEDLVQSERGSMLRAVQLVQDAFRDKKLGTLEDELGKDIAPAVDYLEKLNSKDPKRRAAYFAGFAGEAEVWAKHYELAFHQNARQRASEPSLDFKEERPWRRFSRHFFQALEPLVAMRDETLARTRLLGLSALLIAECKVNGVAPSSLTGITGHLTTDPYTGLALVYRPDGNHFLLYSIGENLKDDGGETDASGKAPDLRLEDSLTSG